MDIQKIREDFPILKREINGYPLIYFDSAASSQKPKQVIDAIVDFYENHNANVMRGVHKLSEEATEMMENSRKKIKRFITAKKTEEIVFTKNTTEAINLVKHSWANDNIEKGDKIVLSILEHHANLIPWQQLAMKKQAKIEYLNIDKEGEVAEGWEEKLKGAKLLAITHISNVIGIINPVKELCKVAREEGARTLIDGSQSVPHMKVNVQEIDCDFFAFTGHKMLGPTGTGILYGKEQVLENMKPFMYGGEMNKTVKKLESDWNNPPYKFEAGTPNVAGIVGLGAAVDYLEKIGIENIEKYDKELTEYALEKIPKIKNIEIIGPKEFIEEKAPIISFNMKNIHAHDVASILNEYGIATRSGVHCAQPLHQELNIGSSTRASFYLYNTKEEIDQLVKRLSDLLIRPQ